jgi:type III pantothenate kinase
LLLTIDIGNTNIAVGVFKGEELVKDWQIRSEVGKTCDEYTVVLRSLFSLSGFDIDNVTGVIISSVVPPLTPIFQKLSSDLMHMRPLVVGPGLKTGMPILYENPLEVGSDRVVSAVAAYAKYGGPCIVVDFGTATTFDAVSPDGEYIGGAIAPGVQISAEALYLKTAKLPRIEIKKPESAIGRTTVSSMQSGLYFGYIGLVSQIIDVMSRELGENVKVVATGGFASLIIKEIGSIGFHEPDLVFDGLKILYEKNKK